MRNSRTFKLSSLGLLPAALFFLAAPVAIAQNESPTNRPKPASTPQESPSSQPNETRTRLVSAGSTDEGPAEKPLKTPPERAESQVVAENKGTTEDKVLTLRGEIEAAPNEQERSRLRLKLVSHLAAADMKQAALAELHSMSGEDHFDPQGLYNIANAQARLGDAEGAVTSYRKAIHQRKGYYSRAFNNLGVVLMRLGRWDEAYDALMSALRLEGFRYAEASYNLGRLYDARGETDLAIREWRRAVAIDPEHGAAVNALARSGSAGNIQVAKASAGTPALRTSANGTPRLAENERAAAHEASAKPTRGASPFTVDPDTHVFLQRARAARDRSRYEEAVEDYRRVIARMGGYFAPANLELSYALISLRRNDEAIASLLQIALKDGARLPISYYHLARLYELKGESRLAEENFSRAADSYGESNAQFLLDLTRVREKLGNFPGALASLERYVSSMERQGQKPEWSDVRLAALRQKVAASTVPKP